MAKTPTIGLSDIELDADITIWKVMRATLRAKEARTGASVRPTFLVLKSQEIVAEVYQSCDEPRTLLVRTVTGIRKISMNWYDELVMLYAYASLLTLQKNGRLRRYFLRRAHGERRERNPLCDKVDGSAILATAPARIKTP